MRILRMLLLPLLLCLVAPAALVAPGASAGAAPPPTPRLVEIRAAHHPGFDRVVFEFEGGLPGVRARYVDRLIADGSGRPVRIAGRAILQLRFSPAEAHDDQGQATVLRRRALALPNVMTFVRAADFEAVTTYGLGLAKKTKFDVFTLRRPSRVVVDVRAAFRTVDRKVWFFNQDNFVDGDGPYFSPRLRPVRVGTPATGVMDRLFAGPLLRERADGLRLLRSHAKGFRDLAIEDGIARVRLVGGCNSDGSTVTIAGEIIPSLKQFPTVDHVKIYDAAGSTGDPTGPGDSIPACLEP